MDRTKYPRTMNFPWSGSNSSDDVWWEDSKLFEGKEVVVTEKLDGECTSIYRDGHCHARSVDTNFHPSRSWVRQLAGQIGSDIPAGWRICGENVYAWHSIFYKDLPSYFFVYGIYDEKNQCLAWSVVEEFSALLGLQTVPVIYKGIWDEKHVRSLWKGVGKFPTFSTKVEYPKPDDFEPCEAEGYVVRLADTFPYEDFAVKCAKYVRKNHVTTPTNWMTRQVIANKLAD